MRLRESGGGREHGVSKGRGSEAGTKKKCSKESDMKNKHLQGRDEGTEKR